MLPPPRINFTNILHAAFTYADLKSTKNKVKLSVLYVLLGSACVKAAHKMLVKSTPGLECGNHILSMRSWNFSSSRNNFYFYWQLKRLPIENAVKSLEVDFSELFSLLKFQVNF